LLVVFVCLSTKRTNFFFFPSPSFFSVIIFPSFFLQDPSCLPLSDCPSSVVKYFMSEKRSESWCFFVCLFFATLPTVLLLFTFNSHRKKDLWLAASRGDLLTCQAILALSRGEKYKVNFKEPLSGTTALHVAYLCKLLACSQNRNVSKCFWKSSQGPKARLPSGLLVEVGV